MATSESQEPFEIPVHIEAQLDQLTKEIEVRAAQMFVQRHGTTSILLGAALNNPDEAIREQAKALMQMIKLGSLIGRDATVETCIKHGMRMPTS